MKRRIHAIPATLLLASAIGLAQPQPSAQPKAPQPAAAQPTVVTIDPVDASRTLGELNRLLGHYPPAVRSVLALDPSLLSNAAYLAPYPGLQAFLAAHPEILRNPSFYIQDYSRRPGQPIQDEESKLTEEIMGGVAVLTGMALMLGALVWIIRALVNHRRWSRVSKIQTETHTKLLDRLNSNEELLAYIQSPAGAKFLESSPINLDPGPRVAAPITRILLSVQGGVVLAALGMGLHSVAGRAGSEGGRILTIFGNVVAATGVGFLLSAFVSYVLSRRLGLIEPPAASKERPAAGERAQ